MDIDYNNINTLVKLLYEFVYSSQKDTYKKYMFEGLDITDIELGELIKKDKFDDKKDKKDKKDDNDNDVNIDIKSVLKNKIAHISTTEDKKKVISNIFINSCKTDVIAIFQKHDKKNKDTVNLIDIYYELLMQQIISSYVIVDKIPFYILNICNFNIPYKQIKDYEDVSKIITKNFDIYDHNDKSSLFCVSLYENYFKTVPLIEYLKQELPIDVLSNIVFQVLFSYAYLLFKLNDFKHNDFSIYSFFITTMPKMQVYNLSISDVDFVLKTDYVCKLFNFRKSQMDGFKNVNEGTFADDDLRDESKNTDYSYSNSVNYDLYYFFKTLYDFTYKNKKNFEKIKTIISNIIPINIINV